MKKLEDVIQNIRYGSVLTINKDFFNQKNDEYNSCIIVYDGRIFKDVKAVEIGDLLRMVPNITYQLDQGYIYQFKYLSEEGKYKSTIVHRVREGGYKESYKDETINDFEVLSDNFLEGIIELDTKIANFDNKSKSIIKERKKTIA